MPFICSIINDKPEKTKNPLHSYRIAHLNFAADRIFAFNLNSGDKMPARVCTGIENCKQEGNGPIDERAASEPLRSNMASDLKSVTSITYISMCILLICFGPILWPLRPLQPPKQPRRSDLTLDLESRAQTSYATMFVWIV